MREQFNLFSFQRRGLLVLLSWALGSIATGTGLRRSAEPLLRAAGGQALLWGLVNALLALLGLRKSSAWRAEYDRGDMSAATYTRHVHQTQALLWGSALLDGLMAGSGLWLTRRARDDERWRGAGWGILAHGAFLLSFDLIHALLLRRRRAARTLPGARWWQLQKALKAVDE